MKRSTLFLCFLTLSFCATGCMSARIKPRPRPDPAKASVITFFRGNDSLYRAAPAIVAVDGIESASLYINDYIDIQVEAGTHQISVRGLERGPIDQKRIDIFIGERKIFRTSPNVLAMSAAIIPISANFIDRFNLQSITLDSFESICDKCTKIETKYIDQVRQPENEGDSE